MKMHLLAGLATLVFSAPAQAQFFAAFGDFGNQAGANAVADFVKSRHPEFIVTLGDQCYNGSPGIATQVGNKYGAFVQAGQLWPTLGNHEFSDGCGGGNMASGYKAYFTLPGNERYYDKVIGSVHLFSINANGGSKEPDGNTPTSKQAMWLKGKLAASTSPWKIVFFHQPPYSSGHHGGAENLRWPFDKWGADAVLNGHDHDYERMMKDGDGDGKKIPFIVSGLGGAEKRGFRSSKPASTVVRYNAEFGSLFVTASPTSLAFEFVNVKGAVIDSFSLTKGAAAQSTEFEFRTVPGD